MDEKKNFMNSLVVINKQIKLIENLVNEFSDFARMPKPILKNNDLRLLASDNIKLLKGLDKNIRINLICNRNEVLFNSDSEQISRVFLNLIKNSIESIQEKQQKVAFFEKRIDLEILDKDDYIEFTVIDNGTGFNEFNNKIKDILNPYFTTKKKGTGLGLSIVNKIINDHNGSIDFIPINNGAKIKIIFLR